MPSSRLTCPRKCSLMVLPRPYKDLICVITPQKTYVNFGFPRGADLPDPAKLLTGTGKRACHVKLIDPNQANSDALRALLIASIAQIKSK